MKSKHLSALIGAATLLFGACTIQEDSKVLFSAEEGSVTISTKGDVNFEYAEVDSRKAFVITTGITEGGSDITINDTPDAPWELTGYKTVHAEIRNLGCNTIQAEMYVGKDPDSFARWYCSDYEDLAPGETKTVSVDLSYTNWIIEPQPESKGMRGFPGKLKTDPAKVHSIRFRSRNASKTDTFAILSIRIEDKLEIRDANGFYPFVDEFGQLIHQDWKGKIHSVEELKNAAHQEQEELEANPGPGDRGKYGGWTGGPHLEATGYFRTEKIDGKWWFVDPEGYLFWSVGQNCVSSSSVSTGIDHRENYFSPLPDKDSEYGQFYHISRWASMGFYKGKAPYSTYNFYEANLYMLYGDHWLDQFRKLVNQRFKSWGLNTVGFVSDRGLLTDPQLPYVGSIWIRNTPRLDSSQGYWGPIHDVFDPAFREAVKSSVERQKQGANDPWCIGFFVDNELSWGEPGSLSIAALKSPEDQASKLEFIKILKKKYKQIEKLNAAWGTKHNTWEELLESTTPPDPDKAEEDLLSYYEHFVDTYFNTIEYELHKVAPKQNYMGCRLAWSVNDIVMRTAAKYLDIISFNKYEYSVEYVDLPEGVDKPIIIGEFHFGATDRGCVHPGVKIAQSQEERGILYQEYMQGALRNPKIIGAHWFQYLDQPLTGRGDGENYNVGFVDACDQPYPELIEKVRETTYGLYDYRRMN